MPRRLAVILSVVLGAAGCARHETLVESGDREQVLHFGNKDEPSDMDPQIATASSTIKLLGSLFEGLVVFSGDGKEIQPGAADRWVVSPDGLTYTFHIRDGEKWSNGAALTSKDFLDSFLRALDPQVGIEDIGWAFPIRGARAFVEGRSADPGTIGISAPDPHTFVIVLAHPAPYMLMLLTTHVFYPVYMPSLDASGGRRQRGGPWTRPGALVGNGQFVLADWKPNAYVSVKRNPAYWDAGRVLLSEVRFYPTDDESAEERAFRAGELHVTFRLPKSKVPGYEADHPGELHVVPVLRSNYVTFNVMKAPFTDARVRRAFALAIDRDRLVKAALGPLGSPAHSLVRPGTGGFTPAEGFGFDPDVARNLLAQAGFPGGAGLPPVEFTLNGNFGTTVAVAEVIQQMWAENLGVHVALAPLEFKVYLSTERERQFQILLEGWTYAMPDARDMLELCVTGDPNNDSQGHSPELDAAFAATDVTPEQDLRRASFDRIEAINAREVFYAPIYYTNQGFLVRPSVRGWRDNPIDIVDWRGIHLAP